MPLEVGDFGAVDKDVLSSPDGGLFLLDLYFHDIRRVLNDLGDVGTMTRANFTKNTFCNPDDTADDPVTLNLMLRFCP